MEETYKKIYTKLGLDFRVVEADSGAIGGSGSKEFHVLASSGEDTIDYRDWETDRKSTRLNSSHITRSRMPSSA